ncbi:N-6 DNA methylase [Flavobacterium sp.]|uniref:type I restriction-modification system subunit M n=1 Tax=Flavobacterium sp. TaxID=239 RepID=UPI0037523492
MTIVSLQSRIDRITDILRRDDGISGAMHYTEQISWILFLKYLNDYEESKAQDALIDGKQYKYIIDTKYRWDEWAYPLKENGEYDLKNAMGGDDLVAFVNNELFPYLQNFKSNLQEVKSVKYKIGAIFEFINNRIASGHTLREVIENIADLNFQSQEDLFELSVIYENLLKGMGSDGGNSGEFYTPRPVIKAMVEVLEPTVKDTIYDGAVGSSGFLIQAYDYVMLKKNEYSTTQLKHIKEDMFFGNEKTPLAYVMGVMNMILHGIESPNIYKQNTLTQNIRDFQEKDRHSIILANPPFGGKEKSAIQQNFLVESTATELLFMQHFMKKLAKGGTAGIIIPEGVLFQNNNAFTAVKQDLLQNFNLHTILSLPAGVFLPYSAVKTDVVFFERKGGTQDIWYYEINLDKKLTKKSPIQYEQLEEFVNLYKKRTTTPNSWTVSIDEIKKNNYNISAKNPAKQFEVLHQAPSEIIADIQTNDKSINKLLTSINQLIEQGYEE